MTHHQKAFFAWIKAFQQICQDFHGTPPTHPLRDNWQIPTDLGILNASVNESDYESQKKRHCVAIYLRFETYDTGKVHDTLFGRSFNGYSGKWNIGISGGESLAGNRDYALNQLTLRLLHVTEKKRASLATQTTISREIVTPTPP